MQFKKEKEERKAQIFQNKNPDAVLKNREEDDETTEYGQESSKISQSQMSMNKPFVSVFHQRAMHNQYLKEQQIKRQ